MITAALGAFSFVFIHPFEDGNGRMHRFLILQALSSEGFTPLSLPFPVSAAILRDRTGYDAVLGTFSKVTQAYIDRHWTAGRNIALDSETASLYGYYDATPFVEYLYAKVAETIRKDLKDELDFMAVYDASLLAVRDIIDMPDRRANLFVCLCLQNGSRLGKAKCNLFTKITDGWLAVLQDAMEAILVEHGANDTMPGAAPLAGG